MPVTIRLATFETNSSSAHALCFMTYDQYDRFLNGGDYLVFPERRGEVTDNDKNISPDFPILGTSTIDFPLEDTCILVPPDRIDEALDCEQREYFYGYGRDSAPDDAWWAHQLARAMTYEDMTKSWWETPSPLVVEQESGVILCYEYER